MSQQRDQPDKSPRDAKASTACTIKATDDVALLGGRTPDGKGISVLRARQGRLELGEVRPLEAGKAIVGDVVSLKPRKACPVVCDVETHLDAAAARGSHAERALGRKSGPAQVASDAYRQNWDTIYRREPDPEREESEPELLN